MKVVISSGHGKKIPGAVGPQPWGLDEHAEAVNVVNRTAEFLCDLGVDTVTYEDTVSTTQNENLKRIVDYHNSQKRDLDVSIHFNCYQSTSKPMGTECLYVTQEALSNDVADALSDAADFIDRGAKKRTDLYFLNNTAKPAILVEVCFVDSEADVKLYHEHFDTLCEELAEAISGEEVQPSPLPPPSDEKPTIGRGDNDAEFSRPYVSEAQTKLNQENNANLTVDGDFGGMTDSATRSYQASRGLEADGWIGPQTWDALDTHTPPLPPPPGALTAQQQEAIKAIALNSSIAGYSWKDRGRAPAGYTQGMALAFAQSYLRLKADHPAVVEMARARTNSDKDALNVYRVEYQGLGMSNETSGIDTLRHLYALMLGHGMRESSGYHCEGRDQSASNVSSDTAEAGLFQTSYNAHGSSDPEFDQIMDEFAANPMMCYLDAFSKNVQCGSSDWANYGSGRGYQFQDLCKKCPPFAVESAALTLRSLCNHYGPIIRKECELRRESDTMLQAVQDYMEAAEATVA